MFSRKIYISLQIFIFDLSQNKASAT